MLVSCLLPRASTLWGEGQLFINAGAGEGRTSTPTRNTVTVTVTVTITVTDTHSLARSLAHGRLYFVYSRITTEVLLLSCLVIGCYILSLAGLWTMGWVRDAMDGMDACPVGDGGGNDRMLTFSAKLATRALPPVPFYSLSRLALAVAHPYPLDSSSCPSFLPVMPEPFPCKFSLSSSPHLTLRFLSLSLILSVHVSLLALYSTYTPSAHTAISLCIYDPISPPP
jgi:hypothetical protein